MGTDHLSDHLLALLLCCSALYILWPSFGLLVHTSSLFLLLALAARLTFLACLPPSFCGCNTSMYHVLCVCLCNKITLLDSQTLLLPFARNHICDHYLKGCVFLQY